MGGDLNCPLNPIIDKKGSNLIPRQPVINTIEFLQSKLDLHEVWRMHVQRTSQQILSFRFGGTAVVKCDESKFNHKAKVG